MLSCEKHFQGARPFQPFWGEGLDGLAKTDHSAGKDFPKDCPVIVTGVLSFDRCREIINTIVESEQR